MPAYTILAWLRRRRAVTRGVRRPIEAYRSAFSVFTGHDYSARPPLLLPPANWRERLHAVPIEANRGRVEFDDVEPVDATPAIEVEEIRVAQPLHRAPRVADERGASEPRVERQASARELEPTRDVASPPGRDAAPRPATARPVDRESPRRAAPPRVPPPTPAPPPISERTVSPAVPAAARSTESAANIETVPSTALENANVAESATTPAPIVEHAKDADADAVTSLSAGESQISTPAPEQTRLKTATTTPAIASHDSLAPSRVVADEPIASPRVHRESTVTPRLSDLPTPVSPASESPANPSSLQPASPRREPSLPSLPTSPLAASAPATEPEIEQVARSADVIATPEAIAARPIVDAAQPTPTAPAPNVADKSAHKSFADKSTVARSVIDVVTPSRRDDSLVREVESHETVDVVSASVANDDASSPETVPSQTNVAPKPEMLEEVSPSEPVRVSSAPSADINEDASPAAERPRVAPPTAPSGIRPTEERRGRRTRPATQSESTQPRSARAPEASEQTEGTRSAKEADAPIEERSTVDWRRLLFEATSDPRQKVVPAPPPAKRAEAKTQSAPKPQPPTRPAPAVEKPIETEPLLESTRRFLRPRVGIDPATVPVVRGPIADRLVRDAGADAAAVADAVVLPSEHDERSPRTLALIAHELTHVAQRRQPRFVPPVLRAANVLQSIDSGESPSRPFHSSSEEQLARRVERSVWNEAEFSAPQARGFSSDARAPHLHAASTSHFEPRVERESNEWGGLPAPWEPLPVMAAPAAEPVSAPIAMAASAGEQTIHYAEHGRAIEEEQASTTHAAPADTAAPPPDLDALARRVYDVLKRRLAAERRREG